MVEAFSRMLARRPRLHAGGFKPYLYKTTQPGAALALKLKAGLADPTTLASRVHRGGCPASRYM